MAIPTACSCEAFHIFIVRILTQRDSRYLRGRTKEEAFRIGHEIADTVTAMNPVPIKLKFEKAGLFLRRP